MKAQPKIVSAEEWHTAQSRMLEKEKAATRARDALSAERRRLPMMKIEKAYTFESAKGLQSFLDLFENRRQLIIYHFMYHPKNDSFCKGCSMFVDQIGHLAHIHQRDTSLVIVARAPLLSIERHKKRMGWNIPWYSSLDTTFNVDMGVSTETEDQPGLSVFFRDGKDIYRSYFSGNRGLESLGSIWTFLDLTPLGRQEKWEDSPPGYPQTPPYEWWNFHDEYPDQRR